MLERFVEADENLSKKKLALTYTYVDVIEDENDDSLDRIGIWQLEGDVEHQNLLSLALDDVSVSNSVALVVLDLARPWDLMNQVERWMNSLQHVLSKLDPVKSNLSERKQKCMF